MKLCYGLHKVVLHLCPKQGQTPQTIWYLETATHPSTALGVLINGLYQVPIRVRRVHRHPSHSRQTHEASSLCTNTQLDWYTRPCQSIYPKCLLQAWGTQLCYIGQRDWVRFQVLQVTGLSPGYEVTLLSRIPPRGRQPDGIHKPNLRTVLANLLQLSAVRLVQITTPSWVYLQQHTLIDNRNVPFLCKQGVPPWPTSIVNPRTPIPNSWDLCSKLGENTQRTEVGYCRGADLQYPYSKPGTQCTSQPSSFKLPNCPRSLQNAT